MLEARIRAQNVRVASEARTLTAYNQGPYGEPLPTGRPVVD